MQLGLNSKIGLGLLITLALSACSHPDKSGQEREIRQSFSGCQQALLQHEAADALTFFPQDVNAYFQQLNSPLPPATKPSDCPGVDLLLRTALERKVPAEMRANLTLAKLMQRISDRHLLSPHDVAAISLGQITVTGQQASGEIFYQGSLTALRLPFRQEDGPWKIDLLAIRPYAEILMRLDRAWKHQSEQEQVEQLVNKLPSL